ncbi:metal-dependent hydrolase [Deinococcus sp. KNUC1210]|uniref:metal-dependent hydrolase n=1 Tax=Deinococcus sp. KNUC1210 TaxID=2917691 RepID=UPI001EF0ED58|nr:metal-dependent hydrolase [Deinococcus sp. KNUC1210]ULH16390.1 metal-dependent hydrolase [Deinococcus sp. KNUC1210]
MNITFIGHSAFLLEDGEYTLAIDPFIQGNPKATLTLDQVKARNISAVLISHAHGDHWGDALALAENGAAIIGTAEIGGYAGKNGAKNAIGGNIGGTIRQPWGSVYLTPAWHSSSFPDGSYGGMPTGLVIEFGGKRLYFAGDTALFSDMSLIGEKGIDLAFLPIGDHYTMGPQEAARCLDLLKPKDVIPMHYGTFPPLTGDPHVFAQEAQQRGVKAHLLQPGETLSY